MPLPQVNDRLKEIPAQALRTLFATIGQLLLVADRLRVRAAEQLSGSGEAAAAPPSDQAPAPARAAQPTAAPARDAGSTRWRSLDKTGNVRVLDGDEDQDAEDYAPELAVPEPPLSEQSVPGQSVPGQSVPGQSVPGPSVSESSIQGPVTQAAPEPARAFAEYTPTEPVPAVSIPAEPTPAEPTLAEPTPAAAGGGEVLPVPNYDEASVASLRARLRVLDPVQVQILLDYEKAHESRPAVITMFERRLTKLREGS
jgi:hypothetical protein